VFAAVLYILYYLSGVAATLSEIIRRFVDIIWCSLPCQDDAASWVSLSLAIISVPINILVIVIIMRRPELRVSMSGKWV